MREVHVKEIQDKVEDLCIQANCYLPKDVIVGLKSALDEEQSPVGKDVLQQLLENAFIAGEEQVPICQDTGIVVVFLQLGQDVHLIGGPIDGAINAGIRRGYKKGYLRKSVVSDPLIRKNTQDNTPAIIHTEIVPGDRVILTLVPKGAGSENMSQLSMLTPAQGKTGVISFIQRVVEEAGANPCPPIVIGVGVGGNMEKAAYLAKKSLLRPLGQSNQDPEVADLEREVLTVVNSLGIGPQGFGGTVTALAVHIETHPTHIASLPVAVNISCHATRHATVVI